MPLIPVFPQETQREDTQLSRSTLPGCCSDLTWVALQKGLSELLEEKPDLQAAPYATVSCGAQLNHSAPAPSLRIPPVAPSPKSSQLQKVTAISISWEKWDFPQWSLILHWSANLDKKQALPCRANNILLWFKANQGDRPSTMLKISYLHL